MTLTKYGTPKDGLRLQERSTVQVADIGEALAILERLSKAFMLSTTKEAKK